MKKNEEFKFTFSVSTRAFSDKNKINWGSVQYKKQSISIEKFVELIKSGYAFCNCFDDDDEVFGQSVKTLANFRYTNCMMIDIDDCKIEMNDLINQLSVKPTLAYTTPNNLTEKSNFLYRYRLCFLFEEKIKGIDNYCQMYSTLINLLINDVKGFELEDNCAQSANQQFGGSNEKCSIYVSYNIYDFKDFSLSNFLFKNNIKKERNTLLILNRKNKSTNKTIKKVEVKDNDFIKDVEEMIPHLLIEKYRDKYKYFTSTELTYNDKGVALIPDNYIEIYRSWYKTSFIKNNGTEVEVTAIKKYKDGERRRKKLYIAALIMKKIMPEITYEHLLFNLINERYYYYNNTDKQLSNAVLSSIAVSVVNTPIEDIKLNSKPKKAKFKVDKTYCECVLGISANQYKQIVKKQLNDELIGANYDCSLSVKENLEYFKENGIKVGKDKLYIWCKENGIETNPNKKKKNNECANASNPSDNFSNDVYSNEFDNSNFLFKNNIKEEEEYIINLKQKNENELSETAKYIYSQLYEGMESYILEYALEKYKDNLKESDIDYLKEYYKLKCVA